MAGKSIDSEVEGLFESALQSALEDDETKCSLEKLAAAGLDVSVEKIRADVEVLSSAVLGRTQTMLDGWRGARERLDEVRAEQRSEFPFAVKKPLMFLSLISAVAAFFLLPPPWRIIVSGSLLFIPVLPLYGRLLNDFVFERTVVARRASAEARARFLEVLETQVTVAVREAVNRRLTSFEKEFRIFDRRGLRQLADPDREVSTVAAAELEALIASLDSGSIGLSGPRGCGKTTLIKSFTEGRSMPFNKERIGLTVTAPVKYDAQEFVLHLFSSLCERVLLNRPDDLSRSGSRSARTYVARQRKIMRRVALLVLGSILGGIVLLTDPQPPGRETWGILLVSLGGVIGFFTFAFWLETSPTARSVAIWLNRRLGFQSAARPAEKPTRLAVERAAREYLEQIRFQQSREGGRAAEISLPLGLNLGSSHSTTLARTPWTLPEAVEEFRRFAAILSNRFVVIGIDELDKMESDKAAREFLNNVKGVFGVQGCYYLVSVSEDAMSAFERRGLPLRDVFDSSFDEIQRVGYLDLAQSRSVLESRVTGLPVPFQCLCHCLAGGLPRDLIRVTRELVHHHDVEEAKEAATDGSIKALSSALVETEWRGKLAGAIGAVRSAKVQPWWLTRWLHTQTQEKIDAEALRVRALELGEHVGPEGAPGDDDDAHKAQRIAIEMMVFNYYAATVIELFGCSDIGKLLSNQEQPDELDQEGASVVETLAIARQQFSIDPWLSWGLVEEARRRASLMPWNDLRPAFPEDERVVAPGG